MRFAVAGVAVFLTVLPATASQPEQALDCSDWVFPSSGVSCAYFVQLSNSEVSSFFAQAGACQVVDNDGKLLQLRRTRIGDCCSGCTPIYRLELLRFDGQVHDSLAFIEDRCNGDNVDSVVPRGELCFGSAQYDGVFGFNFDDKNGRILLSLVSQHQWTSYPPKYWTVAIEGLTTTFEILQTYTPTAGPISFRVPYMPEGFQFADYFDTYYGDLATVGDWSQAQPLQCGYPASPPSVGDYLTVADPLPDPAPGQGRYYVTAVSYQGQRRYGRKSMGGVLSGRDPGVLPGCVR